MVLAEGTQIYPSKVNRHPQRYVVVDGRTGKDSCELTPRECFEVLFEEEDGGESPGRIGLEITISPRAVSGEAP